ncbi:hypothetical protein BHM03_00059960 [Ensete ventricosum]|nr:hypothetical protein BHM03_00059960 [Ensete ventricosum]
MRRLVLPLEDKVSIVPALEDEAVPRSPTGRRGIASSPMRHLVPAREDKAAPHPHARGRGVISFSRWKTRRHLVASFPRGEMPISMVPPDSGQSVYRYLVEPERTTRTGRYRSK